MIPYADLFVLELKLWKCRNQSSLGNNLSLEDK
jgi:hypothetical protein